MPGVEEITVQVEALEADYATESWHTRAMFAHAPKPSVARVKHVRYERKASRLPQEVHPEDIVETAAKTWAEMDNHDYDDNYEASTDPIHPVSTDYSHPLDGDDGAWILQHLSLEDEVNAQPGLVLEFNDNEHDWNWNDDSNGLDTEVTLDKWQKNNTRQDNEEIATTPTKGADTNLVTCSLNTNKNIKIRHSASPTTEEEKEQNKAKIDQVIQAFWSVVNHGNNHNTQGDPESTADSLLPLSSLPSSNDNNKIPSLSNSHFHHLPPPPLESHHNNYPSLWTDGSSDPPLLQVQQSTRSPYSTRAWYDKQRAFLRQRRDKEGGGGKEADLDKFYRDWLYISRCEIRDFEGPEGRVIRDPGK
jgi:hypothetical protein